MSRLQNSIYNTIWALLSSLSLSLFGIVSRSVFINILGDELLGVNSLFADVITLFSFVDMGFGTAITFALYKPIAENNTEKTKSVLLFLQKVFNGMALIILLIGVCFYPFLGSLKTNIPLRDLRIYYVIFMFNNVVGYFWTYRITYVTAKQEARRITVFDTVFSFITTFLQIIVVLTVESFLLYLLINSFLIIVKKITINFYIVKKYPETDLRDAAPIEKTEAKKIWVKTKSLAVHKIANLTISQTDSLIVSYMLGVKEWGFVSNYLILKNIITGVLAQIYGAILPSMGDLVAKEEKSVQLHTFYLYDFVNFWMYAFCFVALATLSSPFINLVFGASRVIDEFTVFLFFASFFVGGMRDPVSVLREANGAYENDQQYTVLSSVVNLITSVVFVKLMGLPGVFLGTICSMVVVLIARPIILFRQVYQTSSRGYFFTMGKYIVSALLGYLLTVVLLKGIQSAMGVTFGSFVVMVFAVTLIPNLLWIIMYFGNDYFRELLQIVAGLGKIRRG